MALRITFWFLYVVLVWLMFIGSGFAWNAALPLAVAAFAGMSCALEFKWPAFGYVSGAGGSLAALCTLIGALVITFALIGLVADYLSPIHIGWLITYGAVNAAKTAIDWGALRVSFVFTLLSALPLGLQWLIEYIERSRIKPQSVHLD